jgi:hypothetical protein
MDRQAKAFLQGFERAAQLTQRVLTTPPRHTSPVQYMRDVALLHASVDDPTSRGLAVGCLSAFEKAR